MGLPLPPFPGESRTHFLAAAVHRHELVDPAKNAFQTRLKGMVGGTHADPRTPLAPPQNDFQSLLEGATAPAPPNDACRRAAAAAENGFLGSPVRGGGW